MLCMSVFCLPCAALSSLLLCFVFDVAVAAAAVTVAEFLPGIIIASIVRLRVRSGRYNLGAAAMKEGEAAWTNVCGCMRLNGSSSF